MENKGTLFEWNFGIEAGSSDVLVPSSCIIEFYITIPDEIISFLRLKNPIVLGNPINPMF